MKNLIVIPLLAAALGAAAQVLPYQNVQLSPEERAADLVSRLTVKEKVQLMVNGSAAIKRLGVPQFEWWSEALHGIGRNGFATVFPITTAMAATWNDPLVEQVFTAVSDEARVKNQQAKAAGDIKRYQGLSFWTPNINIFRDPRWGRGQETYGEDPWLTSRMGIAVVRGLQGPAGSKYKKLLACAKHFAVHSGPEWNRHSFDIQQLPERDLWETYLPAFKALVQEADVAEVMCAYQRIDGEPCCGNNRYESQILRHDLGFKGLIVSDCGAIGDFWHKGAHEVSADAAAASAKAVLAGTDVECGANYKRLPDAIARGEIKEADLDVTLRRQLKARFELGDFDPDKLVPWTRIPASCVASEAHKQLALNAARQSIVLLQNRDNLLPLSDRQAQIVVMGPAANDSVSMWGNYSGYPTATTTIWQGLKARYPNARLVDCCSYTRSETLVSRYDRLATPEGAKGMKATYWNNERMTGTPAATATIAEPINLSNGGATVFAPGVELTHFSARYEGVFTPAETETLTLTLGADDMARLIVDGDTVMNDWKPRARINYKKVERTFEAGKSYKITIDYVQSDGMAVMQFDLAKRLTPSDNDILKSVGDAPVVVFAGGISPKLEGEEMKVSEPGFKGGDRTDIELPAIQRHILDVLHRAGRRVVLLNCSGGAMALVPETQSCDAILQTWYGGERGGEAVADIICGDVCPSGKLPVTFYRSLADLPDFLDYRMANRTYRYFKGQPLFPFGFGLSYTTFALSDARYDKPSGKLTVTVANTGKRAGDEVVQVYIRRTADTEGPVKTLRAFKRVSLQPAETKTVDIDLARSQFECWDKETNTMRVMKGQYEVIVEYTGGKTTLKVKL